MVALVCTGVGVLLLALSTVCYQSIKVVLATQSEAFDRNNEHRGGM
ncbi:hypothetical protein KK062_29160 [Fulvivirgaceae bacterium PWU5]|uniref:Uncharacterized protein n=1 Tax=Dawidia cretensis TaxID=2782350 RepID=A0AAP2GWE3_9BACT|nr:hypothetical protein [Dawidia cretensis]MBT1712348.1 hypothetical protein [Dawidia cretensis]